VTKGVQESEDRLLTVKEVGELLGLSRASVWKLMDSGALSYCRLLGSRRIPRAAVKSLVERALVSGR
jgi:excisionase family DNA binding protein